MREVNDILGYILSGDSTRLSVGEVKYTSRDNVDAILTAITDNPHLEAISLDNLNIASQWLEDIIAAVATCPNMREVSLTGNRLSKKSVDLLAQSLTKWTKLENLQLESTGIDSQDLATITQGFPAESALKKLNLSANALYDEGAQHLHELLPKLPALRHLWLESCNLKDDGVLAIGEELAKATSELTHCSLYYNQMLPQTAELFADKLEAAHKRNLIRQPFVNERLETYCNRNLEKAKTLFKPLPNDMATLPDALEKLPPSKLAEIYERLPALEMTYSSVNLAQGVEAFIDTLPVISTATADIFAADARGYTPLDNPRSWKHIADWPKHPTAAELLQTNRSGEPFLHTGLAGAAEQIIPQLNACGVGITLPALCNEQGKASPLMQQLIDDGTAPLLFTAQNWRGESPQSMQHAYQLLPEAQQKTITNYHTLYTRLAMEQNRNTGIGR